MAYAMAWIEVEEKETARRAYFSLPEEQENLSHSGLCKLVAIISIIPPGMNL